MFRLLVVLCGVACLSVPSASAQPAATSASAQPAAAATAARSARPAEPAVEPVVVREEGGAVTVRATRINEPVALDGLLREEAYAVVPFIDGFLQQEPAQGQPGTERTEVWLLYDDRPIFSFYAVLTLPFVVLALVLAMGKLIGTSSTSSRRRTVGVIASGTFSEHSRQASSGDAFIALLHASHTAALAEQGPTRTR